MRINVCQGSFLFLVVLLAGCTTPDVTPFAESTGTIVTGFKAGSKKTLQSLELAARKQQAEELEKDLQARYRVLDALLVFSTDLAAVQSNSNRNKKAVDQISNAVNSLAFSLGGGVSQPVIALASKLKDEAIEINEFRKISKALEAIAPSVGEITELLLQDVRSTRNIYNENMIEAYNALVADIEDRVDEMDALDEQIKELQASITSGSPTAEEVSLFAALYPLWAQTSGEFEELQQQADRITDQRAAGMDLFDSLAGSIEQWQKAFEDLAVAFKEKRNLNFTALYIKAQEIQILVDQL